jgi:ABC-type uncharacterized transport system ATPase component|tara:strand:+ start:340 stop:615 length:276 start_codon:yes stop_codon:yes gene_type:complete
MPKKGKKKVKRKGVKKRKQPTYAVEKPRRIATAGQLNLIHNQALKNQARDTAELQRSLLKEKEEQKREKLELEKQVLERRLAHLNPFGFLG